VGHQSPGVLDEIPEHGKGLGREKNALLGQAITAPEALVDGVEPEGWKLSHRSTNRGEERFGGDEIGGFEATFVGTEVGLRYQLTPRIVWDVGIGTEFAGSARCSDLFMTTGFSSGF
jgi:hypothetical protein